MGGDRRVEGYPVLIAEAGWPGFGDEEISGEAREGGGSEIGKEEQASGQERQVEVV